MMGGRHDSWQAEALERVMSEQVGKAWPEHRCAMLSNPAAERHIDGIVLRELWPGVEQALQGSGLIAVTGGGDTTPAQALLTLHREFTTRSLTVVVDDPERPDRGPMVKPWYCRLAIEASIEGCFLMRTTILLFPGDFDMAKLRCLLQEPLMQGYPPELSWYVGVDGSGAYSLELNAGEGGSWSLRGEAAAREFMRRTVRDHLVVIAAMDRLAQDWSDAEAFDALHGLAARAHAAS